MASVTAQATALAASLLVGGTGATPYLGRAEKFDDSRGAVEGRLNPSAEPIDADSDPAIIVAEREERAHRQGTADVDSDWPVELRGQSLPDGPETFMYGGKQITYDPIAEQKAHDAYIRSLIDAVDAPILERRTSRKGIPTSEVDGEHVEALSRKALDGIRQELRARY